MPYYCCLPITSISFEGNVAIETPWAEIRFDLFKEKLDKPQIKDWISTLRNRFPSLIATYRGSCDEGLNGLAQRYELLHALVEWGIPYIDLDTTDNRSASESLKKHILESSTCLILSRHIYDTSWDDAFMRRTIDKMQSEDIFLAKVAAYCQSWQHADSILRLYRDYRGILALGMGYRAIRTRFLAPILGAPFTYAYLDKPIAEGQIRANLLQHYYSLSK